MCGIAGVVGSLASSVDLRRALDAIHHRGRDHSAIYSGDDCTLGYCRLALRGTGPDSHIGNQPFTTRDGRWICFGVGEVYDSVGVLGRSNFGVSPLGDIGLLLDRYLSGGLPSLAEIDGEFAVAFFDKVAQRLILARDHIGTRGLYWAEYAGSLFFASEIKALGRLGVPLVPDRSTVASYLRFNYPPSHRTWYEGVRAVPAGASVSWKAGLGRVSGFAGLRDLIAEAVNTPPIGEEGMREALVSAVESRTTSDRLVGQHLSGGVDSSLIAHLSPLRVPKAYVLEYGKSSQSYSGDYFWAAAVAEKVGVELKAVRPAPSEALARVPEVILAMDGPLMSPGAITPYLVAEAAAQDGIAVLLEGQGADEVFLGYDRFRSYLNNSQRDLVETIANVARQDIAMVGPQWNADLANAEAELIGGYSSMEGLSALVRLQAIYLSQFLHELLRIEDHAHLASTVENRPPFLARQVVRAGLSLAVHSPSEAIGKQSLRRWLGELHSPAARRMRKQQMALDLKSVMKWASDVLDAPELSGRLISFDRDGMRSLFEQGETVSRARLAWALANLAIWANECDYEL